MHVYIIVFTIQLRKYIAGFTFTFIRLPTCISFIFLFSYYSMISTFCVYEVRVGRLLLFFLNGMNNGLLILQCCSVKEVVSLKVIIFHSFIYLDCVQI